MAKKAWKGETSGASPVPPCRALCQVPLHHVPAGTRPFMAVTWDGRGAARSFSLSGRVRRRRAEAEGQHGCRHTRLPAHQQISLWCLYYFLCLIFEKKKILIQRSSGPPAVSTMLPGKAEKRMASSVFITLVPPRREAATKDRPQTGLSPPVPEGTHRPRASPPQPPALPNGGEGRPWGPAREDDAGDEDPAATLCKRMRVQAEGEDGTCFWGGVFVGVVPQTPKPALDWIRLLGKGCVCSPSPGPYQLCLSPPAQPAFAFGAGRRALRQSIGVLLQGEKGGMGAGIALPTRRARLFLQKAALGPRQRPCLRPHQSSSSPKCPSPCPRRRWLRRCSSWTSQRLPPCRSAPRGAVTPTPQFPHP